MGPQVQSVNAEIYCKVLKRLMEIIQCKRLKLWRDRYWLLHHGRTRGGLKSTSCSPLSSFA